MNEEIKRDNSPDQSDWGNSQRPISDPFKVLAEFIIRYYLLASVFVAASWVFYTKAYLSVAGVDIIKIVTIGDIAFRSICFAVKQIQIALPFIAILAVLALLSGVSTNSERYSRNIKPDEKPSRTGVSKISSIISYLILFAPPVAFLSSLFACAATGGIRIVNFSFLDIVIFPRYYDDIVERWLDIYFAKNISGPISDSLTYFMMWTFGEIGLLILLILMYLIGNSRKTGAFYLLLVFGICLALSGYTWWGYADGKNSAEWLASRSASEGISATMPLNAKCLDEDHTFWEGERYIVAFCNGMVVKQRTEGEFTIVRPIPNLDKTYPTE